MSGFSASDEGAFSAVRLREGCHADCPACAHRTWTESRSLEQKSAHLHETLAPWRQHIAPIRAVSGENRWGYRRRVRLAARWRHWQWQFGLESREEFIPIPNCPVQAPEIGRVLQLLAERLPPPDQFPLRFFVQNGALATLVLKTRELPSLSWLDAPTIDALASAGLEGLLANLHPSTGSILFYKNGWRTIWGRQRAVDSMGLRYGPAGFQQLIPELYRQALTLTADFLAPDPDSGVADLYCGNGATLREWTRRGVHAVGVEINAESVEDARHNAPSATVLRGLCAERLPQLRQWAQALPPSAVRLASVNPPRTGMEPEVLQWIAAEYRPRRIAYLSCSAGTLRRDLDALTTAGWNVAAILPFDFFPQTRHVETLTLLNRSDCATGEDLRLPVA